MTPDEKGFGTSGYARFIARAPLVLTRHLWLWPLLGAVMLGAIGLWTRGRVEGATRDELAERLQTLLRAEVAALQLWFSEQEADAKSFAVDTAIQGSIVELAALDRDSNCPPATLLNSDAARTLVRNLQPLLEVQHYLDYVVIGPDRRVLASPRRRLVGQRVPVGYEFFLKRTLAGIPTVSRPFSWAVERQPKEAPTMVAAAPVKSTNGGVVAVLGLRLKPQAEFSRIFSVARMGQSGEAYAFDRQGFMLTVPRFDWELKRLGLIPDTREATAVLNLRLLDPGVDLEQKRSQAKPGVLGTREERARSRLPLTRMAAVATRGGEGVDVQGYRNYRGVEVVGAWTWLPRYGMGVATEEAADEAFGSLYVLRRSFWLLFLLLVLSGGAIFAFTLLVERLQASVRKNALTARRLGQYILVQEIGRGAHGMVYRAQHSLLRRPVAVKLLDPELTNETTAAHFEREVQITSQLTHPNTVAIYDYGSTPEGLFYYAMEYLSGIDLAQLVRRFGPQPEGRAIHILRQVCGSLAEAHHIGLIHRDIKPANIVLTRRAGMCDVVKVLDFGLVKARHAGPAERASAQAVVGTPHFMSPEAVAKPESGDARSDLYSVGAVGYWLLTGKTLFDTDKVEELLVQQVKGTPSPPSQRLGREVSADLEKLIMDCLAKSPEQRPPSAEALEAALGRCAPAMDWTAAQGKDWWKANMVSIEVVPTAVMAEKTLIIAPRP